MPMDALIASRTRSRNERTNTTSRTSMLPIGIDARGRAVFLYLVLPSARDDFRAFLGRHADLFRMLPFWTLRLVFPRSTAHAYPELQSVVRDELESPLHARTVEELRWYARYRDGF